LPGGFVDRFETAEEALIREIREELNLQISDLQYIGSASNRYPYKEIEYHTIDLFFVCSVANIDGIVAMDDITAFRWVAPDDLDSESFPFDSIREGVRLYLNWKQK
jgi:8-oxo-dGTP pyrophosphatase MutT (NUDIX family)